MTTTGETEAEIRGARSQAELGNQVKYEPQQFRLEPLTTGDGPRTSNYLHLYESLQEFRPFNREKALRVKLDAVKPPGAVADTHDFIFVGPGGHNKIGVSE